MNRAALVAALAITWTTSTEAIHGQSQDEKPIIDILNRTFEAEQRADFNALVSLVHPQAQHLFRDILSARTDVLLRSYAQTQISAVSGLPAHPKDLSLSDAEFFTFTCHNTKSRHADFATEWKYSPFTLEGTTFDTGQRAHAVLSFPGSVRTERTSYNFVSSFHIFFKQERSKWLIWSAPFAQRIGDLWCHDLAQNGLTAGWAAASN